MKLIAQHRLDELEGYTHGPLEATEDEGEHGCCYLAAVCDPRERWGCLVIAETRDLPDAKLYALAPELKEENDKLRALLKDITETMELEVNSSFETVSITEMELVLQKLKSVEWRP